MHVLCEAPDVRKARGHDLKSQPLRRHMGLRPDGPQAVVGVSAVLRLVAPDLRAAFGRGESQASRGFDARLLDVLAASHGVNAARLQLLDVLDTQAALDRLTHLLRARTGDVSTSETRKLEKCVVQMRRTASLAGDAWTRAGRVFTRLTRLLPVQLEEAVPRFEPVEAAEMARLAQTSEWRHLGNDGALRQLARERARRRDPSVPWATPTQAHRNAWAVRMQEACSAAAAHFADARERYEQAAAAHAETMERATVASRARQAAENGFRIGVCETHELAASLIEHSLQRREVLQKAARACMARYTLYMVAGLLPGHFDLE